MHEYKVVGPVDVSPTHKVGQAQTPWQDDDSGSFALHALSSDVFRGMSRDVQIATALKHLWSEAVITARMSSILSVGLMS